MRSTDIYSTYPISWISKSSILRDFLKEKSKPEQELLVADFASGEHDRVPSFFIKILSNIIHIEQQLSEMIYVYCVDTHALRLDSLLGKLEESDLLKRARVVKAKRESMDENAEFRPTMMQYLNQNAEDLIWLDDFLIGENRFPPECFDIGILNNDIIGYLMEYYTEYSNAMQGLEGVKKLIKSDGLLIVTNPCSLYVVDNVTILQNLGFNFIEGIDIDLESGKPCFIEANQDPKTMSRLGHYTFLVFRNVREG